MNDEVAARKQQIFRRLRKAVLALLIAVTGPLTTRAEEKVWSVETDRLSLALSPDGRIVLTDQRIDLRWEFAAPGAAVAAVTDVQVDRGRGRLDGVLRLGGFSGKLAIALKAGQPEFSLAIGGPAEAGLKDGLMYPLGLKTPVSAHRLVLPHKTGLLFGLEDFRAFKDISGNYDCYAGKGLAMPWFGFTDLEKGCLVILETPDDAGVKFGMVGTGDESALSAQVYWQPTREKFGYERKLTFRLFDRGGYVAMCKDYRRRLMERGEFATLRQKKKKLPQLAKLIGAMDLHIRDQDASQKAIVEKLQSSGAKQLLINSGASPQTLGWMRQRGCLVGSYRIYTDIHEEGKGGPHVSRGWPEDAYTMKNGSPIRGFAFSDTRKTTYRCSIRQLPLMEELLPPLVKEKGYEALFLDVVTAMGLQECWHTAHPIDRRMDRQRRIEILKYTASLGLVVGSEDGNDWAAPYLHYYEGISMPRRFGYIGGINIGNWPKTFDLDEEYKGIDLNERVRVPLWDLVFHDSVVSTWRWNFTPDRYSDAKWRDKHDLFYLINGHIPIFPINQTQLQSLGDRVVRSYKDCSEWHAKIGWDELVDHRVLTPDRSVQESRFSSGLAVSVNFSEREAHAMADGAKIAPMSYRIGNWKGQCDGSGGSI